MPRYICEVFARYYIGTRERERDRGREGERATEREGGKDRKGSVSQSIVYEVKKKHRMA